MSRRGKAALATAIIAVPWSAERDAVRGAAAAPPPITTEFLTSRAVFTDDVGAKFKIKHEERKSRS